MSIIDDIRLTKTKQAIVKELLLLGFPKNWFPLQHKLVGGQRVTVESVAFAVHPSNEVFQDLLDHRPFGAKADDLYRSPAMRVLLGIDLLDFFDAHPPPGGRIIRGLLSETSIITISLSERTSIFPL